MVSAVGRRRNKLADRLQETSGSSHPFVALSGIRRVGEKIAKRRGDAGRVVFHAGVARAGSTVLVDVGICAVTVELVSIGSYASSDDDGRVRDDRTKRREDGRF